jgi:hypothetical protein
LRLSVVVRHTVCHGPLVEGADHTRKEGVVAGPEYLDADAQRVCLARCQLCAHVPLRSGSGSGGAQLGIVRRRRQQRLKLGGKTLSARVRY